MRSHVFRLRGLAVLTVVFAPALAAAQPNNQVPQPPGPGGGTTSSSSSSTTTTRTTTTPAPAPAPTPTDGAKPDGAKAEGPKRDASGYAYSDKPAPKARTYVRRRGGPVVNIPGFEQLPDGSSRLFVALTNNVPVEERKAQGTLTYVLKGAHVRVWNNTNALVTVHFNTPVSRARLVPHGKDLHFVVELRSAAAPTWKITEAADKSALLTIDFAKGDFAGGAAEPPKPLAKEKKPSPAQPKPAGAPAPAPGPNP